MAIFLLALPAGNAPAFADERPNFIAHNNSNVLFKVQTHLNLDDLNPISSPAIARHDLNNDGISEYIVTDQNCSESPSHCLFLILADNGRSELFEIGRFTAREIKLSNSATSGVRDLKIYQNDKNHFHFDTANWNNNASRYIILHQEYSQ